MGEHSPMHPTSRIEAAKAHELAALRTAQEQVESEESLMEFIDEGAFNPGVMARRFEALEIRHRRSSREEEAEKAGKKEEKIIAIQRIEKAASDLQKRNPEMQARTLVLLRSQIKATDTKDEILKKVLTLYPDVSLADEALDFLLETSEGALAQQVRLAKEDLHRQYGREIRAGQNIAAQTQQFAKEGLAPPPQLRALYREVITNPRDVFTLFEEFSTHFKYDKLKTMIAFLLHSLGSDLKSKGPSIDRGELHRLLSETGKLQAILGLFRFFQSRMQLIRMTFARQGLFFPGTLSFELLTKQFVKALQERYPSADKILQLAAQLGISDELAAQVIIYTQMRDAMRQVAPKLFRSGQHRQDLLNAFMDAIEDLDEKLEEDEEEDKS